MFKLGYGFACIILGGMAIMNFTASPIVLMVVGCIFIVWGTLTLKD